MAAPARVVEQAPGVRAALAVAVACGSLVAVQARINGQLGSELGDAVATSLLSFAVGLGAVAAAVALRRASRDAWGRVRTTPVWTRLGGVGGAVLVAVNAAASLARWALRSQ